MAGYFLFCAAVFFTADAAGRAEREAAGRAAPVAFRAPAAGRFVAAEGPAAGRFAAGGRGSAVARLTSGAFLCTSVKRV